MRYRQLQQVVLSSFGEERSAASLLTAWSSFVDECEQGYSWDVSEYRNELGVRAQIELIVVAKSLNGFGEHQQFLDNVESVDSRFRANAHPTWTFSFGQAWWEKAVPENGVGESAEGYLQYGVRD